MVITAVKHSFGVTTAGFSDFIHHIVCCYTQKKKKFGKPNLLQLPRVKPRNHPATSASKNPLLVLVMWRAQFWMDVTSKPVQSAAVLKYYMK